MSRFMLTIAFGASLACLLPGIATGQTIGPDVVVDNVGPIAKWGNFFTTTAYSFGTRSCNLGDAPAAWIQNSTQHPVIACNMYRLKDDRFQQIGISWLKHGFCALTEPGCGTCTPFGSPCDFLGIQCADTYGSTLNGNQSGLGPRHEVNPATGVFPYPFEAQGLTGPLLYKRIQVADGYLAPVLNPDSSYFYEAQYVHPEEAAWGTQFNNVSYRQFQVSGQDADGFDLAPVGDTIQQTPALYAWQNADPTVEIYETLIPGDGKLMIGAKAIDLGGGQWRYEYAVYNMNSDRAAGSFSVSLPVGTTVSSTDFQDIHYHSGEPYMFADWVPLVTASKVSWSTVGFAANPNANALRWGTIYNFSFQCNTAPTVSDLTLGLFKPGGPGTSSLPGIGPGVTPCSTPDFIRGDANGDGGVDISDAVYILAFLFQLGPEPVPVSNAGDANADSATDVSDTVYLLTFLFTLGSEPPAPFPNPGCE